MTPSPWSRAGRRLRLLSEAELDDLPGCPGCPPVRRDDAGVVAAVAAWGWCGVAAVEDGRVVGHLVVEPITAAVRSGCKTGVADGAAVRGEDAERTGPVEQREDGPDGSAPPDGSGRGGEEDGDPGAAGDGAEECTGAAPRGARILRLHPISTVDGEATVSAALARQLVESVAARLLRRRVAVVQAEAHRWAGDCARPPSALLASRGFVVVRQHPVHPTMQLDLGRAVPGEPLLGPVWRRLSELVRSPPPEPIGFTEQTRPRSSALGG